MNIGEANDINTVARYFLGIGGPGGPVGDEQALKALEGLTQKAYKALSAGLGAEQIRTAFAALVTETDTLEFWVLVHRQRRERLLRLLTMVSEAGPAVMGLAEDVRDILDLPGCACCPPGCNDCTVDTSTCTCSQHPDPPETP